ncbi:restriction endonuclease subunit S (plasmid) [Sinorhizobium meliloti]|nr:restriction endonuclease subunit S [Sinorhizobium meliloti]
MVKVDVNWTPTRLRSLLSQDATYGIVKAGTFVQNGVPMIRGGDIKGGRIGRDMPLVSESKSEEYKRTVLKRGDVLIALVGYPGESAVVPHDLEGANISRAVGLFRPGKGLLPEFLCCYLNSSIGRSEFLKPSAGSAQIVVNLRDLNNLSVPLPRDIDEQKAVAEALSDADALIESLESVITKKNWILDGATESLLSGHIRLPGFRSSWSAKTIGDFYDFKNGLNKEKRFFGFGTPIINYVDVFSKPFVTPSEIAGCVSLTYAERENFSARNGDVFFTRTSETVDEIGLSGVLLGDLPDAVFSGFLLRARQKTDEILPLFAAYLFRSPAVRRQIISKASYTTRALTNGRALSAVKIDIPPRDEQAAIASTISDMGRELTELNAQLRKVKLLKEGMRHALLTEGVRLV